MKGKVSQQLINLREKQKWEFIINSKDIYFTSKERELYAKRFKSLIARYLIKKDLLDMLNRDDYYNIEILNNNYGKPYMKFGEKIKKELIRRQIHIGDISMSHSKNYIVSLIVYSEAT